MIRKKIPEWLGIGLIRSEWISIRYIRQGTHDKIPDINREKWMIKLNILV